MITGDLPPRPTVRVRVATLLVPHGIAENGDMLVGMQLSPVPDGAPGAPNTPVVDLVNWPREIRAKLTNLTVHLGTVTSSGGVTPSKTIGPITAATRWSDRAAAAADRLWQETFNQTSPGDQAADLCAALNDDIHGARSFAARSGIAPLIDSHLLSRALATDYRHRVMTELSHGKAAADRLGVHGKRLRRWSPPGSALGGVGVSIEELELKQRHDAYQNALRSYRGPQLSTFAANTITLQIKRGTFSLARARARYRAEELDGSADPSVGALLEHLVAASGGELDHAIEELAIARNIRRGGIRTLDYLGDKARARRKFSSILTSPAIATFLGVNAELRIPRSNWDHILGPLNKVAYGAIGVSFDGTVPTGQGWTAFVHGGEGGPRFFGPCDEAEALAGAPSPTAAIVGGLVRLRVNQGSDPRYLLDVTDTVASTAKRVDFATQALGKLRSGEAPTGSEPHPVGRGLTLVDKAIHPAIQSANARVRQLRASPGDHVNFAADLLHGYSVMFAIPRQQTPSLKSRPEEWRTAVGRSLSFRSAKQIDPTFVAECVSFERGFGIVDSIPVTQDTQDEYGNSISVTSTPQELFSWHGGSLTVAQPTETMKASAAIGVSQDLAVSRRFNLPDVPGRGGVDYRPPPLRDGRGYLVGLSATYVGGWSLAVQEAAAAHAEDRYGHVLGDPLGKPFEFRRPDKLPAPLVLLPSGSRMVTARLEKDLLGESLMTIVVRTGDTTTSTSRRFLFPHAVDFDRAEQQDQFRGVRDDEPAGAFRSDVGILWRRGGGSFPLAMNGGIATSPRAKLGNSRGQVLKFESPEKQRREYHPDGNSQFLRLHLGAQVPADLIPPAMKEPAPFWGEGQRPRHAMPVLLEVRRLKSDSRKARVTLEHSKEYVDGVEVRSIVISMQPATTIAVAAVAEPLPIVAVRQHMFGDVLKDHVHPTLTGGQSLDYAAAAALATMLAQQVVSTLNGVQAVTLVHAQQRPAPPTFLLDGGVVTPVVVTVAR